MALSGLAKKYYDFHNAPLCDGDTFTEYLWYHFCEWFRSAEHSRLLVLTFLVQAICVVSTLAYAIGHRAGTQECMLRSWGWIVNPDGGVAEPYAQGRLIGALTSIGGIVVFALLVSMLTDLFQGKMRRLQLSQQNIVEHGHTVLIQWTDKSAAIVRELALAAASEGGTCIAVLDPRPLVQVQALVEEELSDIDLMGSRVAIRTGMTFVKTDMEKVAAESAKSIIIQSDPTFPQSETDAVAMRKVLALKGYGLPKAGHIIVPLVEEENRRLVYSVGGEKVRVIMMHDIIARLMVHSIRHPGITAMFDSSFGFEGNEIYLSKWPSLTGLPFKDVTFRFEDAVPFGVKTACGKCLLPPPAHYQIKHDDVLIFYAEDNDTYQVSSEKTVDYEAWLEDNELKRFYRHRTLQPPIGNTLIIGWNSQVFAILECLARSSRHCNVTLFSAVPVKDRVAEIEDYKLGNKDFSLEHLYLTHIVGSSIARRDLARLRFAEFSVVLVLANFDYKDGRMMYDRLARVSADGKTMASILLVQDIVDHLCVPAKRRPHIVPEILHSGTARLLKTAGINDFVDSNRMVSLILSSVSEDPLVLPIVSQLVDAKGSTIHVRCLADYLPKNSALPEAVSFWDVVCIVRRVSNDVVVGWGLEEQPTRVDWSKRTAACHWELNPVRKHEKIHWKPGNRLIIIGP